MRLLPTSHTAYFSDNTSYGFVHVSCEKGHLITALLLRDNNNYPPQVLYRWNRVRPM